MTRKTVEPSIEVLIGNIKTLSQTVEILIGSVQTLTNGLDVHSDSVDTPLEILINNVDTPT